MGAKGKKRIKRNWAELFEEFHRSGLSVKEFCRTNGISPSLFYLRRKDYGNVCRPGSSFCSSDFIQLQRVLPSHTRPAAGLLAHVVISKYVDHLPLYRLEGILGRHDIDITRLFDDVRLGCLVPLHGRRRFEHRQQCC